MLANFPAHWFFIADGVIGSVHEKICSGYTVTANTTHFLSVDNTWKQKQKLRSWEWKTLCYQDSVGIISEFNFSFKRKQWSIWNSILVIWVQIYDIRRIFKCKQMLSMTLFTLCNFSSLFWTVHIIIISC